jgi:hypothetical protein
MEARNIERKRPVASILSRTSCRDHAADASPAYRVTYEIPDLKTAHDFRRIPRLVKSYRRRLYDLAGQRRMAPQRSDIGDAFKASFS